MLDENPVKYVCGCSKEKLENYFCTLSDDDIRSMVNEQGVAVATCHFCNKKYVFTKDDLEKLIAEKNSKDKDFKGLVANVRDVTHKNEKNFKKVLTFGTSCSMIISVAERYSKFNRTSIERQRHVGA